MLQIKKLTMIHRKDLCTILDKFDLSLNSGDKAVIIGEEGNGKSTLLRYIYNPLLVDAYVEYDGERILGKERLGYLPQELSEEDAGKTLYEFFCGEETFWNYTPKELVEYARKFSLDKNIFYSNQKIGTLSGGEKVKVQLIRILMQNPTALLLDEPSNDIDIATLELIEKIICSWEGIVLFISHDETLIEKTANMVVHIEKIQRKTKPRFTIAHMPYRQYVEERIHNFERQEQQANNDRREKKIRDKKYLKILQSVEKAQAQASRKEPSVAKNLKDKMHVVKSMGRRFERDDDNMTEMPEQEEAIFFKLGQKGNSIPNGKTVIELELPELVAINTEEDKNRVLSRNIFLRVKGSEKICIVGANGIGKTTLLKKIASVLLERQDIQAQYMPQNYEDLLDLEITPVEFLDTTGDKAERTMIRTYLGSLKYTADEMSHPIRELSGGQKAKVLLLKMSLSKTNVLILDEPTRNFSPMSGSVIRKMIREFPGAVISISHDRKYIDEVCDTVYELTTEGLVIRNKESL